MRMLLSVLVLAASSAFGSQCSTCSTTHHATCSTAHHATVYLTDGESVEGCVVWQDRAGVLLLLDCNPHPYFARDHEVFIEADRICRIDEYTVRSCSSLKETAPKGQWAAQARKADAEIRKAEPARLAVKTKDESKTVAVADSRETKDSPAHP